MISLSFPGWPQIDSVAQASLIKLVIPLLTYSPEQLGLQISVTRPGRLILGSMNLSDGSKRMQPVR